MLREVIEAIAFVEDPRHDGAAAEAWLRGHGAARTSSRRLEGERGHTDVVVARFGPEEEPCLGILGVLGGTGMRPERPGMVSDADGAIVAMAVAASLARGEAMGDALPGPVIVATHLCPAAHMRPHHPAPMMTCPVPREAVLGAMLDPAMAAVLSVDASKANRVLNRRGFAITPTAKEGWLLRTSDDLLGIMETVTGEPAAVLPITMQDITPYAPGVRHINSIMQPAVHSDAAVVGVALTAASLVAGSATGATYPDALDAAARFCREVARGYAAGRAAFLDEAEFGRLVGMYGTMRQLQGCGA